MTESDNHIVAEANRRRTFAIISHPDAGKTTLTEALLLLGGAIREAGLVKGKQSRRAATSDWMEIERQRGISVTSTVLQFPYQGRHLNILDTPGHEDFSDDTYRTLTAADSVVMLIDAAKGVEPQTIKLFQVCRLRQIPIYTFINKMDRESRDPLDLLKELEDVLGIRSYPMTWPVGAGGDFQGVYHRQRQVFEHFRGRQEEAEVLQVSGVDDARLSDILGAAAAEKLLEDVELLDVAGEAFDLDRINRGDLTPVFFGSALAHFGVQSFLNDFVQLAPNPTPRKRLDGTVMPTDAPFSGFIFKIQANMNPAHRDRVAFLRICSGKFERGMSVHHVRLNRPLNLSQSQQFFAQDRTTVEEAFPGDIVGLHDPGLFQIGDTLSAGEKFQFEPLPQFSPEHFARVTAADTLKHKQFQKGLQQLSEEGAIQLFRMANRTEDLIIGVVGRLQFEVFEHRLRAEYGAEPVLSHLPYKYARWLAETPVDALNYDHASCMIVRDQQQHLVMLFSDDFALRWVSEKNPQVRLYETSYGLTRVESVE
ncbi:peptide chain release factor 3 [Alicyclobacillus cycloheptanicus]|uniref:Peptide chain release factor 3 n=1 Tax=Alicyclobacillus cycloheptanicus TaxID=1457 RepID=A0ABT9XEI8_9BACL|nr:peptide chain release factor 3 [Alicyclobacillus cycloheptanicus]MDQ0188708.1 peptide chain release factor 3 [Alicyclobacillus cycloheptanicus]WDM00624.1 peptide chain release factor 3 [Alicyclobacillus cycloheptanicus]